jgi:uncharacterized membrane protein
MLVVVFDTEDQAYEGREALLQLDGEGSIALFAYAVVAKDKQGKVTVKQSDGAGPLGALVGTSLGSLIGLLGGPVGLAVGAATGVLAGSIADLDNARIDSHFVDDVAQQLLPGRFAVLAEVQEEWTSPVDIRMEAAGGTVYRRALSEVADNADREEVAAMKADLAQFKAELANAHAERKAKLNEKITQLEASIQRRLEQAKQRRQAAELQAKAKVDALKAKAAALKAKALAAV